MFNIAYQRNAHQNHNKVSPQTCQTGYHHEYKQQMLVRMWRKRNPSAVLVRLYKSVQLLWKTVCRFLKKLKIEPLYDPTISQFSIHLKMMRTMIWKVTCTPMFAATLVTIAKIREQLKCLPTDEWRKWDIYVCVCVIILCLMNYVRER